MDFYLTDTENLIEHYCTEVKEKKKSLIQWASVSQLIDDSSIELKKPTFLNSS